jgi:3-phenylpropionate/trans-cinnamate dioxygenase ferredoxin subunit
MNAQFSAGNRIMSEIYRVCKISDVPDPGMEVFEISERFIVLFHVNGAFFALDDACTHDGGPLGEGVLDGYQIICPRHGARFDVRTGQALSMPAVHATPTYKVEIEGNDVFVRIEKE